MDRSFEGWLRERGYDERTISSRISGVRRVERHHGSLDEHFSRDGGASIIGRLRYSAADERRGRPNPTLIPIRGVLRTNLASYQSAVGLYHEYLCSQGPRGSPGSRGAGGGVGTRSAAPPPSPSMRDRPAGVPRTLADFDLDGFAPLRALIAGSHYGSIAQAIASLTSFTHPDTVRQTCGRAVFFAIRDPKRVGEIAEIGGRRVLLDDNKSPTDAFLWANRIPRRGRDTQFNHVYAASGDVEAYTALPNICMTPAFIAKLTDTDPDVRRLLRFRSFDLYGWRPATEPVPRRPDGYDGLDWAPPLAPVADVRRAIEDAMARRPKDRTVKAVGELGWLLGGEPPIP